MDERLKKEDNGIIDASRRNKVVDNVFLLDHVRFLSLRRSNGKPSLMWFMGI